MELLLVHYFDPLWRRVKLRSFSGEQEVSTSTTSKCTTATSTVIVLLTYRLQKVRMTQHPTQSSSIFPAKAKGTQQVSDGLETSPRYSNSPMKSSRFAHS